MPARQPPFSRVQHFGMNVWPPVNGDERAMAAHPIAGAGHNWLDQQGTPREIATNVRQRPRRLREADNCKLSFCRRA